jgi:hypothetical protein
MIDVEGGTNPLIKDTALDSKGEEKKTWIADPFQF